MVRGMRVNNSRGVSGSVGVMVGNTRVNSTCSRGGVVSMRINDPHECDVRVDTPPSVRCHTVILPSIRIHRRLDCQPGISLAVQADIVLVPLQHIVISRALNGNAQGELLPIYDFLRLWLNCYGWFSYRKGKGGKKGKSNTPFNLYLTHQC